MKTMEPFSGGVDETTSLRELLRRHPRAIRVLIDRDVPISCAGGSIGDAARACGVAPETLLAELLASAREGGSAVDTWPECPDPSRPAAVAPLPPEGIRAPVSPARQAPSDAADWHAVPIETTLELLRADPTAGLSSEEVSSRLARFGPNTVPLAQSRRRRKPWWRTLRWGTPGWSDRGWKWEE